MARKPTPPPDSFKSIQILSAKAQSLWAKAKAKARMQTEPHMQRTDLEEDHPPSPPRSVMHVDISSATVAKATITVLLALALAWLLILILDKIFLLFLALFVAIVIDAHVRRLERWGVPRGLAVIILYMIFLGVAIFLIASLIPIVATQLQEMGRFINQRADDFLLNPSIQISFLSDSLNQRLTDLTQVMLTNMGIKDRASALFQFGQSLSAVAQSSITVAVQIAGSVFNFMVNLILILFLAFFIQLEREKIGDFVRSLLPREYRGYFDSKAEAIHLKISQWFQGQLILCASVGFLVFIALEILGIPYAQTLALLAGFTEFIPYAGPIIGGIPAVLIATTQAPAGIVMGLIVAGVYYVIQLCENNILIPLIMKHAVGLSPISIMFGMLVGISFPYVIHPVIGIILAVPTTAIITVFVQDLYVMRKKK